jgi:hypothetical protein
VVVYNPLNIEREDVVEATVQFAGGAPKAVRVTGPDGHEVPAQLEADNKVVFLAKAPSVGYAVYDVQAMPSHDAPAAFGLEGRTELARKRALPRDARQRGRCLEHLR